MFPNNNEEYVTWWQDNGMSDATGEFEKLMDNYLKTEAAMQSMQGVSMFPPNGYEIRCKKNLATRDLLRFIVMHSAAMTQALQQHEDAAP